MISLKLILYLSIGTAAMLIPILLVSVWYRIKLWKSVIIALLLTVTGTLGTYILFFVENGWIGGTSFFGAIFIVPVFFPLFARLLRERSAWLLDICAPAEGVMLAIMKVQCYIGGCCAGRELYTTAEGIAVYFPSQLAELGNALLILIVLLSRAHRKPKCGDLYPIYMLIYGGSRFVLNLFRAEQSDFFLGMSPGNVWSLAAIVIGAIWLAAIRKKRATGTATSFG